MGHKWVASAFVLQGGVGIGEETRIGYITTRKLGSAVLRNRARRRLREAVRFVFPLHALPGHDYVLIARASSVQQDFQNLQKDLIWALGHLHRSKNQESLSVKEKDS